MPEVGEIEPYAEFKNSFLGAYTVWDEMGKFYLGLAVLPKLRDEGMRAVWDLWKNEAALLNDRIVMAATFDRVMVRRSRLEEVAAAMDDFAARHAPGHLPQQAQALRELTTAEDCFAVCWQQTSVSADVWMTDTGEVDEYGQSIWRPYDVSKDEEHWFLFDELETLVSI